MGMFGVLDRPDKAGISPEDIRRARALAAQVAVALEASATSIAPNSTAARGSLMGLALELRQLLQPAGLRTAFIVGRRTLSGPKRLRLAVVSGSRFSKPAVLQTSLEGDTRLRLVRRFKLRVTNSGRAFHSHISWTAADLLGPALASRSAGRIARCCG